MGEEWQNSTAPKVRATTAAAIQHQITVHRGHRVVYLKALRLDGLAQGYEQIVREAEESDLSYRDFLRVCLEHELAHKRQTRVRRLNAQACFPVLKSIDSFDFSAQPDLPEHKILGLMDAGFVRAREAVLVIGNTLRLPWGWRHARRGTGCGSTRLQTWPTSWWRPG